MWTDIATLVLGVATTALTANLFAGYWSRVRREIKADAELLEILPEGAAKSLLRARVDDAVVSYVLDQIDQPPRSVTHRVRGSIALALLAGPAWAAGLGARIFDNTDEWTAWAAGGGGFGLILAAMAMWSALRAVQRHRDSRDPDFAARLQSDLVEKVKWQETHDRTR